MDIKIGADEIILWLRKNEKCQNVSNLHLGKRISNLMTDNGGKKILDNHPSYWDSNDDAINISDVKLPKTSEQYSIPQSSIQALYNELVKW